MTGFEVVDHKGLQALGIRYCKYHIVERLEKQGDFPRSFKLRKFRNSPRVWRLAEVLAWLESRSN